MSKGVLYDFRKSALRYAKSGQKPYLYQSSERVRKDELIIGNYYRVDVVKMMLFNIIPYNNEFSFKNEDKEITLYYHNLGMHFQDKSGTQIILGKLVFRVTEYDVDEYNSGFTLKTTKPDKVYLEITPEGIIKIK